MTETAEAPSAEHVVHLADAQRLLALFTQGLAGRYLHLKPTDALTGQFRPDGATTDGSAIYLPDMVADFDDERGNFGVYRVAVLHQLGFYEFGTFDFSIESAESLLSQMPPARKNEDFRQVGLERLFNRFSVPSLARALFQVLEDHRIDSRLVQFYPGIRNDLARVLGRALDVQWRRPVGRGDFAVLMHALQLYSFGADPMMLVQLDGTGQLEPMLEAAEHLRQPNATVYDTVAVTIACYEQLWRTGLPRRSGRNGEDELSPIGADEDDLGPFLGPDEEFGTTGSVPFDESALDITGPAFRGELQPELVQRQLRLDDLQAQAAALEDMDDLPPEVLAQLLEPKAPPEPEALPDGPPGEDTVGPPSAAASPRPENADALAKLVREQSGELKRRVQLDQSALRRAFGDDAGLGERSFYYDEWDVHQQAYLKGWCRLFEHRLVGEDFSWFAEVKAEHRTLANRIKNQFRMIRAESYARVKRVSDGEELDIDALIEAVLDRRTGVTPDENVYMRREKSRREVAAAFLLDMSASTDDPIPDPDAPPPPPPPDPDDDILYGYASPPDEPLEPEPVRRRVIDVMKDALALMSEALTTLGDSYGIYGFSGYGRDEVEYYVAKEFEEGLNARTKSALAAMKPRRSTRMGPAIRHAIQKLQRQDVPLKVLIILSDGFPQDCDYGPDRTDHEYGIQDTAKALLEAHHRGVETFCITVDQSGHDYLRRMCPDNRYMIISELESLPDELSKIYRSLTL